MENNIAITDHAIIRYLERVHKIDFGQFSLGDASDPVKVRFIRSVHKIDIDKIKEMIFSDESKEIASKLDCSRTVKIKTKEFDLVITNNTIVTVTIQAKHEAKHVGRKTKRRAPSNVRKVCKVSLYGIN